MTASACIPAPAGDQRPRLLHSVPLERQHPGYNWVLIVALTLNFGIVIGIVAAMIRFLRCAALC